MNSCGAVSRRTKLMLLSVCSIAVAFACGGCADRTVSILSPDGVTILRARVATDAADPPPLDCVILDFEDVASHATYSVNTGDSYIPYVNRWEIAWMSKTRAVLTSSGGRTFWEKQADGTWSRASKN